MCSHVGSGMHVLVFTILKYLHACFVERTAIHCNIVNLTHDILDNYDLPVGTDVELNRIQSVTSSCMGMTKHFGL